MHDAHICNAELPLVASYEQSLVGAYARELLVKDPQPAKPMAEKKPTGTAVTQEKGEIIKDQSEKTPSTLKQRRI